MILQIDESPLDGKVFDREALEALSKEGVTLVCFLTDKICLNVCCIFFLSCMFLIYYHLYGSYIFW